MEIYLVFSQRDLCAVIVLSLFLLLIAPPLLGVKSISFEDGYTFVRFSDGSFSLLSSIAVLLMAISTIALHEFLHLMSLKMVGVNFKLKPVTLFRLPIMIQVDYEKIKIWQYFVTALSPQALTIVLIFTAYFAKNTFGALLILSAILNFASSSGDFYGIIKTLVKVKSVRGTIFKVGELKYIIRVDKKV